ncbi:hypothetical protein, partial [Anaerococcus tetradius]|uniref:hypothetical protein n=1 Tax=Anaerococcus tetradius TaxID=33036 RepID=UPI0023F23E44
AALGFEKVRLEASFPFSPTTINQHLLLVFFVPIIYTLITSILIMLVTLGFEKVRLEASFPFSPTIYN